MKCFSGRKDITAHISAKKRHFPYLLARLHRNVTKFWKIYLKCSPPLCRSLKGAVQTQSTMQWHPRHYCFQNGFLSTKFVRFTAKNHATTRYNEVSTRDARNIFRASFHFPKFSLGGGVTYTILASRGVHCKLFRCELLESCTEEAVVENLAIFQIICFLRMK